MKTWLKKNIIILNTILLSIISLNYFMDPFWCFDHSHRFNSIQKATNERQQKANYIYFTPKHYNTLLLGSSRTTYMNRHEFKDMNVFNFSAPAMRPKEYLTYINFTISDSKQPIKTIIIGSDFFGYLNYGLFMFNKAPSIVQATKSPLYRWKMLVSFDAINNSIKNIRDYLNQKNVDRYNRDNVKSSFAHPVDFTGFDNRIIQDAIRYARDEYSSKENPEYSKILAIIHEKYHDKQFIIYTTPVSSPLFAQLIKSGQYTNYENWLRTLVKIYGKVYHFMYINSVSADYKQYFADCNHAYAGTNALIAHKITNVKDPKIPSDFGMVLTRENIDLQLQELRKLNGIQ